VLDDSPVGDSSETAEPSKRETVAAGPDLKSLGSAKALMLNHVSYYGGWSEHPSPEGKSNLVLRVHKGGISSSGCARDGVCAWLRPMLAASRWMRSVSWPSVPRSSRLTY